MLIARLAIVIGAAGIVLLAIQSTQVFWLFRRLRAADFIQRGLGTVDVLPYRYAFENGIVVNEDGSLTASWLLHPEDAGAMTFDEINEQARAVEKSLLNFGTGWMVQVDVVRRRAPGYTARSDCHFQDPVCAAIDEERRRLFERQGAVYHGCIVLTLSHLPQREVSKGFVRWITAAPSNTTALETTFANFRAACVKLEDDLRQLLSPQRLQRYSATIDGVAVTHDEQLRWLHWCITGFNHPVTLPDGSSTPWLTAGLIGTQDFRTGSKPKMGEKHIRTVSVDGFPTHDDCWPTILNLLSELPYEYRWNTRYLFSDAHDAEKELTKIREIWKNQTRSLRDQAKRSNQDGVNRDAVDMMHSADDALARLRSGETAYGYYSSTLVVMDEDETRAETAARDILAAINSLGFAGRIERENATAAFLGSLPADARNVRRPGLALEAVVNLLPLSSLWTGSPTAPCPLYPRGSPPLMHVVTHGATTHFLNLHVADVGHTMMFGPTRMGKSVHINLILAQLRRYLGMQIFAFDIGMSMYALTRAIHTSTGGRTGQHYRLGSASGPQLCPLQRIDTAADRDWAAQWIEGLLRLNGVEVTPARANLIASGLRDLAATPSHSITDFSVFIQDEAIRAVLTKYTVAGKGVGAMFDAVDDGLDVSDFNVFELGELLKLDKKYVLPALEYAFRRIDLAPPGPGVIAIEEASFALGDAFFQRRIMEWVKTLAKKNRAVVLVMQNISDATKSEIFLELHEQCATTIFLPNGNALTDDSRPLYMRMGLNEREIENHIVDAVPKRHYYLRARGIGKRQYELELGPVAKAFLTQTNSEAVESIMQLEKEHGAGWIDALLARHNLPPLERLAA